jgi:hypothetical protein
LEELAMTKMILILAPAFMLALGGCVNVHDNRPPQDSSSTTYVTPAPVAPPTTSSTTVIQSP